MRASRRVTTILVLLLICALGVLLWATNSLAPARAPNPEEANGQRVDGAVELDDASTAVDAPKPKAGERRNRLPNQDPAGAAVEDTSSLRIELSYSDGEPGAGLFVLLAPKGVEVLSASAARREARSDSAGIILFEDLSPGKYRIAFSHPQHPEQEIELLAGKESLLQVQFKEGMTIHGLVVDRLDKPVAGAHIWTSYSQATEPAATSDSTGRFVLQDLRKHSSIGAVASGYTPSPLRHLGAAPGTELRVRLVLQGMGGIVQGLVLAADGEAQQHARVEFPNNDLPWTLLGENQDWSLTPRFAITDAEGRFRCDGLPPLEIPVIAQADGRGRVEDRVRVVAGGITEIVLRLPVTGSLHGRVLDAEGSPLVDAWVAASTAGEHFQMTESQAQGEYRLDGLLPGNVRLRVHAGKQNMERSLDLAAGEVLELDLQFQVQAKIRGRLRSESGESLEGWRLQASGDSHNQAAAVTDAEGRFVLESLKQGQAYRLDLYRKAAPWHSVLSFEEVFPSGSEQELILPAAAQATGSIRGRILDWQGAAMAGSQVGVTRADIPQWLPETLGPDGRFHFTKLPVGEYLLAIKAGPQWRYSDPISLQPDQDLDLGDLPQLRPGSISLTLENAEAGSPLRVSIFDHRRRLVTVAKPELSGLENFPMPAGRFYLQIDGEGFTSQQYPLRVEEGANARLSVAAATSRAVELRFQVPDVRPRWQGQMRLEVFDAQGEVFLSQQLFSIGGLFTLSCRLPIGVFHLVAQELGGLRSESPLEIPSGQAPLPAREFELR